MNRMLMPIVSAILLVPAAEARAAQQIECRSSAPLVKAVTSPDYHYVTTRFQFDTPNVQPLLTTTFVVGESVSSCIVAHFSALARITDNDIVFQVRIDGVPMHMLVHEFVGEGFVELACSDQGHPESNLDSNDATWSDLRITAIKLGSFENVPLIP